MYTNVLMDVFIEFSAQYLYIFVVLIGLIIFLRSSKEVKKRYFILSFLTLPLSFITGVIGNLLIKDPRPFIVEHIQPLIHASTDNGFPSDHTLLTMTVASIIFAYHKKSGIFLGLMAFWIGISRVLVFVHHPLDIFGSIVISVFATLVSWLLLKKMEFI